MAMNSGNNGPHQDWKSMQWKQLNIMSPRAFTVKRTIIAVVLFCWNLSVASSQDFDDGRLLCGAPRASVGSAREYLVGANTKHIPLMEYLTDVVGQEFDPPISFRRYSANLYMKVPAEESLAIGYDFMLANPHLSSCFESEGQTVSLVTQMSVFKNAATGEKFNLTQYGAVLYTLKNRTDIQTLADVKGKKIGTNKFTNMATHLCYDVLLRNGIHNLQDPEQTIFLRNSKYALASLLAGEVDVGCAATGTLESYLDPATGQPLDLSQFRILHQQQHMSDEMPFPFAISSDLVPSYPFIAYPHVETSVKKRVRQELLAMRDHADVAPSLLACFEDMGCFANDAACVDGGFLEDPGCLANNTVCVDRCFQALPSGTIRNCDTTAELSLKAFRALTKADLAGFTEPLQNLRMRDIQETTSFLIKDPSPRCVRLNNIVDATTCPSGHFARSSEEINQQCNVSGLPCYDEECICSPCVQAFEVDFFPVNEGEELSRGGVGSGCSKFSLCGSVEQEHVLSFRAIDNKKRPNATMTGALLLPDESEEPFIFENVNGTFQFDFVVSDMTAGQKTVKIRINDAEIPESPFRIVVLKRDCEADTGDESREPDELGQCVCKRGMVEIFDKCMALAILIPCILGPSVILFLIAVHFYVKYKKDQSDNIWKLEPNELHFEDPPRILGRGTFGYVLLAEYRGTLVAVKRVLTQRGPSTMVTNGMPSHIEFRQKDALSSEKVVEGVNFASQNGARSGFSSMSSVSTVGKDKSAWMQLGLFKLMRRSSRRVARKRKAVKVQQNFVEEIRLLSRLRHPSITTVMGAVISSRWEPMLVMEYMHFGSLHDLLHNESMVLEGEVLVGLLQDVASGLRFLHSSDPLVLHGDLKAANILVDDKFRAKVADFGCGDFRMSRKGSIRKEKARGTAYWMAPELLRGETTNTKESDVYAFGIVMYEVFSRKEPYVGESYDEVLRLVSCEDASKRPPVPENCPAEAAKMMKACLKNDPTQRPTAMGLDICLRWLDGASVMTFDVTPRRKKKTEASRTDALLEQMFPHHTAEALKEGRKVEPETHEEVTIVFANIVGYEDIVSAISATKVSDLLDRLYNSLDELCEHLEVFKVETIGDSYMTVTNLVTSQPHHANLAAQFALEAMLVASVVPIDVDDPSAGFVQLRIGFHTGPVVAHVIGTKNARFTLIGDTVNTAARMESSSNPGKIQCSEDSYRLLSKDFENTALRVEERGIMQVKGKDDMTTYWIEPGITGLESC